MLLSTTAAESRTALIEELCRGRTYTLSIVLPEAYLWMIVSLRSQASTGRAYLW